MPAAASTKPPPTPALIKETGLWEKSLCALLEDKAQFRLQAPLLSSNAARLNVAWAECTVSQWRLFDYTMHAFKNNATPDFKKLQGIVEKWNNGELATEISPPVALPAPVKKPKASAVANDKAPPAAEPPRKAASTKKTAATKQADASGEAKSKKKGVKSAAIVNSDGEDEPAPPPKTGPPKARTSAAAKSTTESKSSGKSKAAPPAEPSEEEHSDDSYADEGKEDGNGAPLKQARARTAGASLAKMSKKHAPRVTTWTEADDPCANCKKATRTCMVPEDPAERYNTACQPCKNKKQGCPFAKGGSMGMDTPVPIALFARFDEKVNYQVAEDAEEGSLMTVGELLTGVYLTARLIRDQNWDLQQTIQAMQEKVDDLQNKVDSLEQSMNENHDDVRGFVAGLQTDLQSHDKQMGTNHEEVKKLILSRAPRAPPRPAAGEPTSTRQRPQKPASHSPTIPNVPSTAPGVQDPPSVSAESGVREPSAAPAKTVAPSAAAAPPLLPSSVPAKGVSPPLAPAFEERAAAASALADSQPVAPLAAPSPPSTLTTPEPDMSARQLPPDVGDDGPPVAGPSKRKAGVLSGDPAPQLTPAKRKEGPEESDHEEEEGTPQPPVTKKARNTKGTGTRTRSTANKK